jgi:hypothetical protein
MFNDGRIIYFTPGIWFWSIFAYNSYTLRNILFVITYYELEVRNQPSSRSELSLQRENRGCANELSGQGYSAPQMAVADKHRAMLEWWLAGFMPSTTNLTWSRMGLNSRLRRKIAASYRLSCHLTAESTVPLMNLKGSHLLDIVKTNCGRHK